MVNTHRALCGRVALICFVTMTMMSACSKSGKESSSETDASVGTARPASTSTRTGSCDRVAVTSTCSEYSGNYLAQNEVFLTSSCQKLGGTFVYADCPNTSLVGACTLSTGEVRRFYATGGAGWDADRAKSECEGPLRGSFKSQSQSL